MALRLLGQVVGSAMNNQSGTTQITIQCNSGTVPGGQIITNALLPIDLSSLTIGQNVWLVIALNSTEQSAIAGAVTLNPMSTQD